MRPSRGEVRGPFRPMLFARGGPKYLANIQKGCPWESRPVLTGTLFSPGSAAHPASLSSGFRAISLNFYVPGTFRVFRFFWGGMSDIRCSRRSCMSRVPGGCSRGAPRFGTWSLFGLSPCAPACAGSLGAVLRHLIAAWSVVLNWWQHYPG